MGKKIKMLTILTAGAFLLFFFTAGSVVFADAKSEIQQGANSAAGGSSGSSSNIDQTVKNIINILSSIVGVVAVIMIVVAGFRYVTSAGNEQSIASAKKTLIYAIIGLMIAALAQIIARFVLGRVT